MCVFHVCGPISEKFHFWLFISMNNESLEVHCTGDATYWAAPRQQLRLSAWDHGKSRRVLSWSIIFAFERTAWQLGQRWVCTYGLGAPVSWPLPAFIFRLTFHDELGSCAWIRSLGLLCNPLRRQVRKPHRACQTQALQITLGVRAGYELNPEARGQHLSSWSALRKKRHCPGWDLGTQGVWAWERAGEVVWFGRGTSPSLKRSGSHCCHWLCRLLR